MKVQAKIAILTLFLFVFQGLNTANAQNGCLQNQDMHIVVMGSSTAAGAGASGGNSWVNLYRTYMQSLNPNNQVTNIANGGYNTYKLMPSNFIPPPSRPLPDTNKNITRALSLQPDAIIINLPSNDRAFPMQEQLANFDSMWHVAQSANVPIWICTTQPILSPPWAAFQRAVADSILATYGNFALNFYAPIVDSATFMVDTLYAADAVHVNNAGHFKLFEAAVNANIPTQLLDFSNFLPIDIALLDIKEVAGNACGDSASTFELVYWNTGQNKTSGQITITATPNGGGAPTIHQVSIDTALSSCYSDTFLFQVNTSNDTLFQIDGAGIFIGDTNTANDQQIKTFEYLGYPNITLLPLDTICIGDSTSISGMADGQDTIFWYKNPVGGNPLQGGSIFNTGPINGDTSFYAEAVRGKTRNDASLNLADTFNVNWNGNMFNLIPKTDLFVNGIRLHPQEAIPQKVDVFYTNGSYKHVDTFPNMWTLIASDSITSFDNKGYAVVSVPDFLLTANDTFGITVRMHDQSRRLGYRSMGSEATYADDNLKIIGGRGVSHGFTATFNPRIFNGSVIYHNGFYPRGDCASARTAIHITTQTKPSADFTWTDNGNGSVSFTNNSNNNFSTFWDFGNGFLSTLKNPTYTYQATGSFSVSCIATNQCGSDTITKTVVVMPTRTTNLLKHGISLSPNPTSQTFQLANIPNEAFSPPRLFNALGQHVPIEIIRTNNQLTVRVIDPISGMYYLKTDWGNATVILAND